MKVRASVKKMCDKCRIISGRASCASSATTPSTSSARAEEKHMARIAGIDLPRNKRIDVSLTYIFGIGRTSARELCEWGHL